VIWQFEVHCTGFGAFIGVASSTGVVLNNFQASSQGDSEMLVFINVLSKGDSNDEVDHKNIPLEVAFGDRIESVKAKIQQLEPSLPTFKQLLLFAGQQLEDGHSLEQYGVEDQSTLFLVLKPTGISQLSE
jgi:hypothetical protein